MRVCAGVSIDPYSIDKIHVHLIFLVIFLRNVGFNGPRALVGVSMGESMDVSVFVCPLEWMNIQQMLFSFSF